VSTGDIGRHHYGFHMMLLKSLGIINLYVVVIIIIGYQVG